MSFDPDKDNSQLSIILNIAYIFALGFVILFVMWTTSSCATKKPLPECELICPNQDIMPYGCYCKGDYDDPERPKNKKP